jgi:hypothetical protein
VWFGKPVPTRNPGTVPRGRSFTWRIRRSAARSYIRRRSGFGRLALVSSGAQSFPRKGESTRRQWRYSFVQVCLAKNCSALMSLTSHWIPAFAGMTAFTGPHEKSTSPK